VTANKARVGGGGGEVPVGIRKGIRDWEHVVRRGLQRPPRPDRDIRKRVGNREAADRPRPPLDWLRPPDRPGPEPLDRTRSRPPWPP